MTYITTLLTLFYEYFLTGLFAVGGGLATLPFLTQMCQRHPDWFTQAELANMIAVSESTPGPLGVNMSTYVGFTVGGIPGALTATFALVLPSVIVILIVAKILQKFMKNQNVKNVFSGLRPAVTGLIAAAGWSVIQAVILLRTPSGIADIPSCIHIGALILFAVILILSQIKPLKKLHPAVFIVLSAAVGIIFKL